MLKKYPILLSVTLSVILVMSGCTIVNPGKKQENNPDLVKISKSGNLIKMNQARVEHSATLLENGDVLLMGGRGGGYDNAEIYSVKAKKFIPVKSKSNAFHEHHEAFALSHGKVLILDDPIFEDKPVNEVFDSQSQLFSPAGENVTVRKGQTLTLLPNRELVRVGGGDSSLIEEFDYKTNSFKSVSVMHSSRAYHNTLLLPNNKILILGGKTIDKKINQSVHNLLIEVYDPLQKRTTIAAKLPLEINLQAVFLRDKENILLLGLTPNRKSKERELNILNYNFSKNAFDVKKIRNLPPAFISSRTMFLLDKNNVLIFAIPNNKLNSKNIDIVALNYNYESNKIEVKNILEQSFFSSPNFMLLPDKRILINDDYILHLALRPYQTSKIVLFYTPTLNRFYTKEFIRPRDGYTVTRLRDNKLLFVGGVDNSEVSDGYLNTAEACDL